MKRLRDFTMARVALGRRPAPEFVAWMERMGVEAGSRAGLLPFPPELAGLA